MLWTKSCPRCEKGDFTLESDGYGWFVECLQCGFTIDVDRPAGAEVLLQTVNRKHRLATKAA
jgi:Zn ribbon nucleic-acid-binding protein